METSFKPSISFSYKTVFVETIFLVFEKHIFPELCASNSGQGYQFSCIEFSL